MLLQRCSNGGFARGGEASEPEGEATLATQLVAFTARERGMPCDVSACTEEGLVESLFGGADSHRCHQPMDSSQVDHRCMLRRCTEQARRGGSKTNVAMLAKCCAGASGNSSNARVEGWKLKVASCLSDRSAM